MATRGSTTNQGVEGHAVERVPAVVPRGGGRLHEGGSERVLSSSPISFEVAHQSPLRASEVAEAVFIGKGALWFPGLKTPGERFVGRDRRKGDIVLISKDSTQTCIGTLHSRPLYSHASQTHVRVGPNTRNLDARV